jgi:hypothetical protein
VQVSDTNFRSVSYVSAINIAVNDIPAKFSIKVLPPNPPGTEMGETLIHNTILLIDQHSDLNNVIIHIE